MKSIRQLIQNLKGWITELGEKRKELLAQKAAEEATLLPNLLMKYMEIRKEERKDWTRAGQNRGTSQDLKAVSEALSYLRQKGLSTVEDLEAFLESSGKSAADYRSQMKPKEARSKVIDGILALSLIHISITTLMTFLIILTPPVFFPITLITIYQTCMLQKISII